MREILSDIDLYAWKNRVKREWMKRKTLPDEGGVRRDENREKNGKERGVGERKEDR